MSWLTDFVAQRDQENSDGLAKAEQEAHASGKEVFDLARLEQLLNRGSQAAREHEHRVRYYVRQSELTTLAEYAAAVIAAEPWEDAR